MLRWHTCFWFTGWKGLCGLGISFFPGFWLLGAVRLLSAFFCFDLGRLPDSYEMMYFCIPRANDLVSPGRLPQSRHPLVEIVLPEADLGGGRCMTFTFMVEEEGDKAANERIVGTMDGLVLSIPEKRCRFQPLRKSSGYLRTPYREIRHDIEGGKAMLGRGAKEVRQQCLMNRQTMLSLRASSMKHAGQSYVNRLALHCKCRTSSTGLVYTTPSYTPVRTYAAPDIFGTLGTFDGEDCV